MTERIILFDPAERFVAGTVGQPGERTFFIQVRTGSRITSVSCEKAQVEALAQRLRMMNKEIRQSHPEIRIEKLDRDDNPLDTPIEEEFRVGTISLAFEPIREVIQIDLHALIEDQLSFDSEAIDDSIVENQEILRVAISPSVAERFSQRAMALVNAGRQPCPFCGGPLDLRGHLCPRANGYRR
jgi:uncharacterized repeat protein (TIGR03847 family)